MKKQFFNTIMSITTVTGISSSVMAFDATGEFSQDCKNNIAFCVISAPTTLPMMTLMIITVGPVELTMSGKANEAVIAAQEPAFMVLDNQTEATENPLFRNAVTVLKNENPRIRNISDEEIARVILNIGEKILSVQ